MQTVYRRRFVPRITAATALALFATAASFALTTSAGASPRIEVNGSDITSYLPVLAKTRTRVPAIDPATGLHVSQAARDLYFVTDGVYQSAFLATGAGVVVFDAPPGFATKLPSVIEAKVPDQPIRYLVYSHGHTDHVGGAAAFKDTQGLIVVAQRAVAETLQHHSSEGTLPPTLVFDDRTTLSLGRYDVQLVDAGRFHSADSDTLIYLPSQKFLIAIDILAPGYVPFRGFAITADLGHYIAVFDTLLGYDFDKILTGHQSVLGGRADVVEAREYMNDVRKAVLDTFATKPPLARIGDAFAALGSPENANLAFRSMIESVGRECAAALVDRWQDRLAAVDVWADDHCETMLLYLYTH